MFLGGVKVSIAPEIEVHYPAMNPSQRAVVSHSDGPLLVIAGPGSGKTFSLVLRALNLLVFGRAPALIAPTLTLVTVR